MRDLGLLVLRLVVGGIFVVHGYPKFFGGPGTAEKLPPTLRRHLGEGFDAMMERGSIAGYRESVARTGVPLPGIMVWLSALSQLVGGALLILGWFTRPMAFALCINMLVAITRVHWPHGLVAPRGYQFSLTLLGALLALLLSGPGALSIDGDE